MPKQVTASLVDIPNADTQNFFPAATKGNSGQSERATFGHCQRTSLLAQPGKHNSHHLFNLIEVEMKHTYIEFNN